MELKVNEIKALEPVQFNYEELKKWLTEKTNEYKTIVYTADTIATAKTDRATLNKVAKAINDEKIRIKKEVLKPFEDFETKCKELQKIINDASTVIDTQIKEFEQKEQEEKKEQIKNIFNSYIGDYKELIKLETIFNPRWLNKTYSIKQITEDINNLVVKTSNDLETIEKQFKDEEINKAVKNCYFRNIENGNVLSIALQEGIRIIDENKKLEELKKKQEETKVIINEPLKTENISSEIKEIDIPKIEEKIVVRFEVTATQEQLMGLKQYLQENHIEGRMLK